GSLHCAPSTAAPAPPKVRFYLSLPISTRHSLISGNTSKCVFWSLPTLFYGGCRMTPSFRALPADGITLLPVEFRHVMRVAQLPFHHRNPFGRLLIAQVLE